MLKTPVQDDPSDPEEVAERYISADFSTTESVLKGGCNACIKNTDCYTDNII